MKTRQVVGQKGRRTKPKQRQQTNYISKQVWRKEEDYKHDQNMQKRNKHV
jgi:hypothetical protein